MLLKPRLYWRPALRAPNEPVRSPWAWRPMKLLLPVQKFGAPVVPMTVPLLLVTLVDCADALSAQ